MDLGEVLDSLLHFLRMMPVVEQAEAYGDGNGPVSDVNHRHALASSIDARALSGEDASPTTRTETRLRVVCTTRESRSA